MPWSIRISVHIWQFTEKKNSIKTNDVKNEPPPWAQSLSFSLSRRNEEEKWLTKSICRDAKLLFVADFWWKLFVCLLDENNESGRVARQQAKTLCKWIPPTTTEQFFVRKLSRLEIN